MFDVSFKKGNSSQIDSNMKRVNVENWSTREKLALASSVLRSGDQNWMSVSRVIRSVGEPNRPPDWFAQKQCAVQYDLLLNNVGTPKRKKRNEKTQENNVDTPGETIVRKLTQERMEELKMLMSEYRALYLKEKRELEDINMGKLDDRLNDVMTKLEHAEKHEEDEQAAFLKQWNEKKQKEAERLSLLLITDHAHPHPPVEVKPTSPLLTSLLQSPSPALLHRTSGPTISSILNSAPPVPPVSPLRTSTSTPTTLSKLLETPAMIQLPTSDGDSPCKTTAPVTKNPTSGAGIFPRDQSPRRRLEQVQMSPQQLPLQQSPPVRQLHSPVKEHQRSPKKELHLLSKEETEVEKKQEQIVQQIVQEIQKSEAQIEVDNILNSIKVEVDELTPVIIDDAMEVVSSMESEAEPVEVVVETAQSQISENKIKNEIQDDVSVEEENDNVHNNTGESDVLEDQLDHLAELDSHAVEMIVVGPNQSAVISVHHDGSNENLEDEASVSTLPSSDENITTVTPSDLQEVIKEEMIEITSSELEDNKLELIPYEGKVLSSNNKIVDEVHGNNVSVESVVKDLGGVSATEMKEIIEGAEVIVGDEGPNQNIAEPSDIVVKEVDFIDKSGDLVEVTTTSLNDDSAIETVVEVDSTVVDNSDVQFSAGDTTVKDAGDAEPSITTESISVNQTTVSTSNNDDSAQAGKKFDDDDDEDDDDDDEDDDHVQETDSSSCSIDEIDNQGSVETSNDKISCNNEAIKTDELVKSCKDVVDKEDPPVVTNQVSTLSSSSSSSSSPTSTVVTIPTTSITTITSITNIVSSTIEAVTSSSRPDTPSTEEDNEPVANLVKKMPRKTSDSVPNSPISNTMEDGASLRAWKKSIMLVYNRLATHKFASLFLKPITDEQAHGYHGVIHRPMDLSTIKKNIESGVLRTTVEFQRDMLLMFQNAIMYNNSTTLVYERASEMQKECIQHMQLMVEAMGEGVPLRRESLVVDKLNTRQRGSTKQEIIEITPKRKRTQLIPTSSDSPSNKRRKVEET